MFLMSSRPESLAPGLRWLIRLRWVALGGQCLLFVLAAYVLHIKLPLGIVLPSLMLTAASNALAWWKQDRLPERSTCATLLVIDTLVLTTLLYWLGGPHNPFTAFYLLHITIAALILPTLWTWFGVVLCSICYGFLFSSPHELESAAGISCCGSFSYHLQGMLVAMVLVGICIAFFVGELKSALAQREDELEEARLLGIRNEKFAGLATLAAGVAHELATPLNTIAIVSSDLEKQACAECQSNGCIIDAKLIRAEVDRCRNVLEKLGENTTDSIGENPQSLRLGDIPALLRPFLSEPHYQRVRIEIDPVNALLFVPVNTLLQSLAVLIKNACDADEKDQIICLRVSMAESKFIAAVRDNGPGMDEAISSRAGEPFFTTKETGKGMGLGLFLVRMFAERMKGSLRIQSHPGEGSLITLEFPAVS